METAILAVILFAVMIFPHELGHFLAARAVGVQVNEFAFGMGPALWKKEKNGTLYAIRLLPIGGYCAMEGEDTDPNGSSGAFVNKTAGQKFIVLAAGAFMNVVICVLLLMMVMCISGMTTTTIQKADANRPAYAAGIRAGDQITAVNHEKVSSWQSVGDEVQAAKGEAVTVTVRRDSGTETFSITPIKSQGRYLLGIEPVITRNPAKAFVQSIRTTGAAGVLIYKTFGQLITGQLGMKDLSGPVGIVSEVHKTVSYGLTYFLTFTAFISLNLAIVNLLPLPALDGGRILFLLIRKIGGKRITDSMEGSVHLVGFALLIALTILVTWHDIVRLF